MSTANAGFTDSGEIEAHLALAWLGPTLRVQIGFDAEYTGSTPPQLPAKFYPALVDTGAATECIDSELAEELNLPVVDEVQIAGVQGVSTVNLYLA